MPFLAPSSTRSATLLRPVLLVDIVRRRGATTGLAPSVSDPGSRMTPLFHPLAWLRSRLAHARIIAVLVGRGDCPASARSRSMALLNQHTQPTEEVAQPAVMAS
jgi:hypothetical protein